MTVKIGHGPSPSTIARTYHRIQKLHEEAVGLVLGHPHLGLWKYNDRHGHGSMVDAIRRFLSLTYFVEELTAGAVLEEDELPVAGLVRPRAVTSHHIVVPVWQ